MSSLMTIVMLRLLGVIVFLPFTHSPENFVPASSCVMIAERDHVTGIGSVKETGQVAIESVKGIHRLIVMMTGNVSHLSCMLG